MDLVVVDGPNLYNDVASSLLGTWSDGDLTAYLLEWFDMDRLVLATLNLEAPPKLGVVIFHSHKALGRDPYRIKQEQLDAFWGRQGTNPDASTYLVEIPGEQQETYLFKCKSCAVDNSTNTTSEKGIDTSITTYLLETADRWDSVCLFSQDVDYVPPVLALRRRGKMVFAACSRSDRATALLRACQSHFPLDLSFLLADIQLWSL
ncbi:MAG TPA: NYN domain-containing protein, partial [Polyangiaceae bacterium]